jgi:hypothetical protein
VTLNGHDLGVLRYSPKTNESVQVLHAPASDIGPDGRMDIEFGFENKLVSPREVRMSPDGRLLGLGLEALTIQ